MKIGSPIGALGRLWIVSTGKIAGIIAAMRGHLHESSLLSREHTCPMRRGSYPRPVIGKTARAGATRKRKVAWAGGSCPNMAVTWMRAPTVPGAPACWRLHLSPTP